MTNQMRSVPTAIVAVAIIMLALMAPALWNGYPLLQYDTGGYLARWYEGYLVPSRSTVFGLYLHAGEGFHFWPNVVLQSALTIWIFSLALRVLKLGRGPWRLVAIFAVLSVITTLPWLTSILLTDIFAGLSVLALYLFIFHPSQLKRWEQIALLSLVAFSASTHSATLAMLLAIVAAAALFAIFVQGVVLVRHLIGGAAAIGMGAVMLLVANFALSGQLSWTPGGYGILFGRMLQDGIVTRYLNDHCPNVQLRLCPYRHELPKTADEFLWEDGPFKDLGRFEGLGDEMRTIVLHSLIEYPGEQIRTALEATAKQLSMAASGAGVHNRIEHTYGIIKGYIPQEVPAAFATRQRRGELGFAEINHLHIPVALISMAFTLLTLGRFFYKRSDDLALLAGTVTVATLANAFVCGALSGPHDRYGARLAWVSTFVVGIAVLRLIDGTFSSYQGTDARESISRTDIVSPPLSTTT